MINRTDFHTNTLHFLWCDWPLLSVCLRTFWSAWVMSVFVCPAAQLNCYCGVSRSPWPYNPVEVPACRGALAGLIFTFPVPSPTVNIACLVDASEGVHPDDKGTRAREISDYTNDSPSYECMSPCWVSLHAWCGVRHSWKDIIRHGWFTFHCHNRCISLWQQPSCTAVALRPWSWLLCAHYIMQINTAACWANIHMLVILYVPYVLLYIGTVQSE